MLDLMTAAGEAIDLASSAITIEHNNTLLSSHTVFRSGFSYPVELAHTSKNRRIFNFFDLLETEPNYAKLPVLVRLGGADYKSALLQLGVSESHFSGHLQLEESTINERLTSRKLTDLSFETVEIGSPAALLDTMNETTRSNKGIFTFLPLQNVDFVRSPDPAKAPVINPWNGTTFLLRENEQPSFIVPFFYLNYILQTIAKDLGLSLRGDFCMHPDIQQLVITNPVGIVGDQNISLNAKNHLPPLLLKDFLRELAVFFNLSVHVQGGDLAISWKKTVLEQPQYVDWTGKKMYLLSQDFGHLSDGYHISADYDFFGGLGMSKLKDEVLVGNGKLKLSTKMGALPFVNHPNYTKPIPEDKRNGFLLPMAGVLMDEKLKHMYVKPGEPPIFPLRFVFCTSSDGDARSSRWGQFFDLQINGDDGLYSFAYKNWMDKTHAARRIKVRALLDVSDLHSLEGSKTIRIKSTSGAVVECLWYKVTFSCIETQKLIPTEVELMVLNPSKI